MFIIFLFGAKIADRDDKMKWKSLQICNMFTRALVLHEM